MRQQNPFRPMKELRPAWSREAPHLDEDVRLAGFIQVGRDVDKNRDGTHPR